MSLSSKTYCTIEGNTPLVRLDFNADTRIWIMYFMGEQTPDNRLTHEFLVEGISPALQDVRKQWEKWVDEDDTDMGAALVTTSLLENKIYSNGLDLLNAIGDPNFFNDYLNRVFREFSTLPIPTVASIGGHAFAGGFTLACAHDYRVQNGERGYMCMNEIEFGAPIPTGMMSMLHSVISNPTVLRKVVLEGHRFPAKEAHAYGFVDIVASGGSEGTLKAAIELATKLRSRCAKNAWGQNREIIRKDALVKLRENDVFEPKL
ncbi:hypothetical protein MVES1_003440 [Malassezia vespertilionis]|uniref:Enoyl-CoA hydratase n=1 Tax=Malassezia vespertilionis TaxID=2020962 RepID=A0A2N1J7F2_9BASI|nr:uncharacterized protein MVES1_003440 [Malassezia vespertilionis]PKI82474.1 hypothetical protein MVES_003678 [Malassezia vespertilionis]WFD08071.1 hypothetical protein MVES1_003440 [Malassezia vespertilionis]